MERKAGGTYAPVKQQQDEEAGRELTHGKNLSRNLRDHVVNIPRGGAIRFPAVRCIDRRRAVAQRWLLWDLPQQFYIDSDFLAWRVGHTVVILAALANRRML